MSEEDEGDLLSELEDSILYSSEDGDFESEDGGGGGRSFSGLPAAFADVMPTTTTTTSTTVTMNQSSTNKPSSKTTSAIRLERNKEAARKSRAMKKEYVNYLKDQIRIMEIEVARLRKEQVNEHARRCRDHFFLALAGKELFSDGFTKYSTDSNEAQTLTRYEFHNFQHAILSPSLRFLSWAIDRGATNEDSNSAAARATWANVSEEIGLNAVQRGHFSKLFLAKNEVTNSVEAKNERARIQFVTETMNFLEHLVLRCQFKIAHLTKLLVKELSPEQILMLNDARKQLGTNGYSQSEVVELMAFAPTMSGRHEGEPSRWGAMVNSTVENDGTFSIANAYGVNQRLDVAASFLV